MIKLGILGCGAITRGRHVVSALTHQDIELSALVDVDIQRANALRDSHGINCQVAKDYREILGKVDAVLNALPNYLHAPVNLEFLEAGVHVLSEKPLAISSAEARNCAETAMSRGVVLAVGMPWRLRESSKVLPLLIDNGELGGVYNYFWNYGMPFEWPAASDYLLSAKKAGGGVLLDEGVHLLDCLLSWFGQPFAYECQTDDWGGGLEANVVLRLQHNMSGNMVEGHVRLSRTYPLENRLRVEGDRAFAEILRSNPECLWLTRKIGGMLTESAVRLPKFDNQPISDPFLAELDDFVQAIKEKRAPLVDGLQAAQTIDLIQKCYATSRRIPEPWANAEEKGVTI